MRKQTGQTKFPLLEGIFALAVFVLAFGMALPNASERGGQDSILQQADIRIEADNQDVGAESDSGKEIIVRRGI